MPDDDPRSYAEQLAPTFQIRTDRFTEGAMGDLAGVATALTLYRSLAIYPHLAGKELARLVRRSAAKEEAGSEHNAL